MHPLTIVPEIRAGITDEQRTEWLASDVIAWANESFAIARQPEFWYCVMVGDTCQYAADSREFDDAEPFRGSWSTTAISTGTHDRAGTDREGRVRLAGLLNRALGNPRPRAHLPVGCSRVLGRPKTVDRSRAPRRSFDHAGHKRQPAETLAPG